MSGKKNKKSSAGSNRSKEDDGIKKIREFMNVQEKLSEIHHQNFAAESIEKSMDNIQELYAKLGMGKEELDKIGAIGEEQKNMEKEALEEGFLKQLFKSCYEDDDPYGNGDQSSLKGVPAEKLRVQWGSGMDYKPSNLTKWGQACFYGLVGHVKAYIDEYKAKSNDAKKLIERRETLLRLPALMHVIAGARCPMIPPGSDHLSVMDMLLEAGSNIQCKDMAGYTPLHHCLTMYGNDLTLKMAEKLVKAGADPNAQNRFGCVPLHECTMCHKLEFIKLLVDAGADPRIKDNDGISPYTLSRLSPKIQKLFSTAGLLMGKKAREAAKAAGENPRCNTCGNVNARKRCTRCLSALYCNRECQKVDWKKHKKMCNKAEKAGIVGVETVDPADQNMCALNYQTDKASCGQVAPSKKEFKIKIQVPLGNGDQLTDFPMLVYNKARSYQTVIPNTDANYNRIAEKIAREGVMGCKGYFYASLDENNKLKIQVDNMLPPEMW